MGERTGPADSLVDLLDAHALRDPNAIACVDASHAVSYAELSARSRAGARALRDAGVAAGDTVGVFLSPSVDLIAAVWAILRAGAAYLPLAVDYPAERIAYMAADSELRVVLTDRDSDALARRILPTRIPTVRLPGETSVDAPESSAYCAAAAYTIYTSGTTGSPKGVVISHRAIVNQMTWIGAELALGPGSRILLKTPSASTPRSGNCWRTAAARRSSSLPPERTPAPRISSITFAARRLRRCNACRPCGPS